MPCETEEKSNKDKNGTAHLRTGSGVEHETRTDLQLNAKTPSAHMGGK